MTAITETGAQSAPKARVLIVEDTPSQAELLRALLVGLGHDLKIAATAGDAFELAKTWQPHAILLDLDLPDYPGTELMRRLRADGTDSAVVVITANASLSTAVDAMREGAVDFLVKPFNKARLTVTLSNCLEKRSLAVELREVRQKLDRTHFFNFIGASQTMQAVYRTIELVASSKASVFVTGESGTGKELTADALHRASPRKNRPFIALNCGAIPKDLLESEIFGHVKGAFTGATDTRVGAAKAADGGTLFLDEIGEMPLDMQVKLLRFVQTGTFAPVGSTRTEKVDVRFVCATNRDPMVEVAQGRFREDLFYRLYVIPLDLPPLRDRNGDVILIARHFLTKCAREENRQFRGFALEAEKLLAGYAWPGNVRQLENVIRNITVLHDGELVQAAMLPPILLRGMVLPAQTGPQAGPKAGAPTLQEASPAAPLPAPPTATLQEAAPPTRSPIPPFLPDDHQPAARPPAPAEIEILPLAEMERRLILAALDRTAHDVPRAAALLQVNPSTIYRKLQSWRDAATT